jgi:hypothetical protein
VNPRFKEVECLTGSCLTPVWRKTSVQAQAAVFNQKWHLGAVFCGEVETHASMCFIHLVSLQNPCHPLKAARGKCIETPTSFLLLTL